MAHRWLSFIGLMVLILVLLPSVSAYGDYKDEFNESGESATFEGSWAYLTNDGVFRDIEVYKYCSSKCVYVLFDVGNTKDLNTEISSDFFESFLLKTLISDGGINEGMYIVEYTDKSITCDYIAPKFTPEVKNLAVDITTGKIIPDLLPKNAKNSFLQLREIGKEIGLIKSANIPIIVIGAFCIGSDLAESSAMSTLNTCRVIIQNIKANKAYEGQAEELAGCHSQAMSNLNMLKLAPNNLFNYVETGASNVAKDVVNTGGETWCLVTSFITHTNCSTQKPQYDVSNIDKLSSKINELQMNTPKIDISNSQRMATESSNRIVKKKKEVSDAASALKNRTGRLDKNITENSKSDLVRGFFQKPYDFTDAKERYNTAYGELNQAEILSNSFKFNSALTLIGQANSHISQAEDSFARILSKGREINTINVGIFVLVIFFILLIIVRKLGK